MCNGKTQILYFRRYLIKSVMSLKLGIWSTYFNGLGLAWGLASVLKFLFASEWLQDKRVYLLLYIGNNLTNDQIR